MNQNISSIFQVHIIHKNALYIDTGAIAIALSQLSEVQVHKHWFFNKQSK